MAMTSAQRNARYRQKNPLRAAQTNSAYKARNRSAVRRYGRIRERERREAARVAAVTALGSKCARCGFSDHRALQIDHVNDDGHTERHMALNCVKYYRMVKSQIASGRYQLLCANCNWIKEHDRRTNQRLLW